MVLPVRRGRMVPRPRTEPFREFEDLYERMGRLFEETFGDVGRGEGVWAPYADIEETEDAYMVKAELPGVRREDINLELRGRELSISGETKEPERAGAVRHSGRRWGSFDYRLTLPGEVQEGQVEASLSEGVLTVRAPKTQSAQPHRIEIKGS